MAPYWCDLTPCDLVATKQRCLVLASTICAFQIHTTLERVRAPKALVPSHCADQPDTVPCTQTVWHGMPAWHRATKSTTYPQRRVPALASQQGSIVPAWPAFKAAAQQSVGLPVTPHIMLRTRHVTCCTASTSSSPWSSCLASSAAESQS